MSEKRKKGKVYPFADYLHQDEHILWVDEAPVSKLPSMTTVYYYGALISLCLWVIAVNQSHEVITTILSSGVCVIFIFIMGVFVRLGDVAAKAPLRSSYALTNKHVFCWVGDQVIKVSVKDIPPIQMTRGIGSKGMLSFDGDFAAMTNIDDAAYVKTMIEQARKHRLEEDL